MTKPDPRQTNFEKVVLGIFAMIGYWVGRPEDSHATRLGLGVRHAWLLAFVSLLPGCGPAASEQTPVSAQRPAEEQPPAKAKGVSTANAGPSAFETKQHALGTFAVASGELIVSDPCYDAPKSAAEKGLNGLVPKVKKGTWSALVQKGNAGDWGERCFELMTHHVDHPAQESDVWGKVGFVVGVDSGQAGIFDRPIFEDDSTVPEGFFGKEELLVPDEPWYSMCCKQTMSPLGAGVIPGGAVSESGIGDGGYECQVRTDPDGAVVGLRIVFLTKDDL